MLEQRVRVFGLRLAEREVADDNLRKRTPHIVMEKVGEGWDVYLQATWENGEIERMDIEHFVPLYKACDVCRELHEISNLKIVTLEDE